VPASFEEAENDLLAQSLSDGMAAHPEVSVDRRIYPDNPRGRLLDWSRSAQLVVVGSRGRGGFRGMLLGSTSNTLASEAQCPVMVVRPAS
jgi:nucleotide-binding universal stress UspA family protein